MKKIQYYTLILVLVLGALGAGYAAWYDEVKAEGTVNTGNIDVQFVEWEWCIDQDKDVATCDVEISEDGKTLTITISDYYPCAGGVVAFVIENKGSIPVKVSSLPKFSGEYPLKVDLISDFCETGWDYQKIWRGVQLGTSPQCDSSRAMGAVLFEVPQHVCNTYTTMNLEMEFTVEFDFIQWNKYEG